jgi:hypothetical protein
MRRYALALAVAILTAGSAHALTFESPRVEATLMSASAKDPFRVRGRLTGVDLATVVGGPVTVRFGELLGRVPAGGFKSRNGKYAWKSYLLGVKKITINTKKSTIDVVGGGVELGDLPGPVTLAIGTAAGAMCAQVSWDPGSAPTGGKKTRRLAQGPLAACSKVTPARRAAPARRSGSPSSRSRVSRPPPPV